MLVVVGGAAPAGEGYSPHYDGGLPIRRKTPIRNLKRFHREWGCPLTKNRTPWCFRVCAPKDGMGPCGRLAPHSLTGRTDDAIRAHLKRLGRVGSDRSDQAS